MRKNRSIIKIVLWNLVLMNRIMDKFIKQLILYLDQESGDIPPS